MGNIFSNIEKKDLIKLGEEMDKSEEMIESQFKAAIDVYSQVKGDKALAYAKKNLEDTNDEIIKSNGFIILQELLSGNKKIGIDKETDEYLKKSRDVFKRKIDETWVKIIEELELPSSKMLLRQQAYIYSLDEKEIHLKIQAKWYKTILSRESNVLKAIENVIGEGKKIVFSKDNSNNQNKDESSEKYEKEQLANLSLLKPNRDFVIHKKNLISPSLPWLSTHRFMGGFFYQLTKENFSANFSNFLFGESSEKNLSTEIINFKERTALLNFMKNKNNHDLLIAFIQVQIRDLMNSNDEDSEKDSFFRKNLYDKIVKKFHQKLSESIRNTEDILPKKVNYMDPIWKKFLLKAEKLRESIFEARFYAQQNIPNYFGSEKETLFEDIFQFLNKNNQNPIAIPTIEKLGGFDGGFYLVKKISNIFGGLKNIRVPYSKWVIDYMDSEDENNDLENDENYEMNLMNFKSSVRWESYFEELKKYSEQYFNSKKGPQISLRSYSPSLAKWVMKQRHDYKKNILNKEKISLLNEIKDWQWY